MDALPLKEFTLHHIKHEVTGRPPYYPSTLVKLYMYGYRNGLRSSNKLHQACLINVEVWWLLKGLKPSTRSNCNFRANNAKAFKKAIQHFVLLLKEWKLIEGQTIAIDSFKTRAQNSLKNNFNKRKIVRHVDYVDNKIAEYENQLNEADGIKREQEIKDKIDYQKEKKGKYKAIEEELNNTGQKQISKVDTDARSVVLHRNIVNVGNSVQAGCDGKHKLIVNAQTSNENDTLTLAPMAIEAKELLQVKQMNVITNKGYTTRDQIAECTVNNITTYSSPKVHSIQKNGLYDMQIFEYITAQGTDTWPCRLSRCLPAGRLVCWSLVAKR